MLKEFLCKSGPRLYKEIDTRIFALALRSDGKGVTLKGGLETDGRSPDPDVNVLIGLDGPRPRKENRYSNSSIVSRDQSSRKASIEGDIPV